jgi:predicted ArsR family transcriptional regulator
MSDVDEGLTRRIRGVGTLTEPVRRALYLFVAGHTEPVSRDAAAAGLGIARHLAKFHLDRLVDEGLLETQFQRLTDRTGPGAGRPAKLYRRAAGEVSVSLPERQYRLAGELMAAAIDASATQGVPVLDALSEVAARRGREVATGAAGRGTGAPEDSARDGAADTTPDASEASEASATAVPDADAGRLGTTRGSAATGGVGQAHPRSGDAPSLPGRVCTALAELGYEPAVSGDQVLLRNCPFHALAAEHTALVCGMNLALLGSFGDALGDGAVSARLDPAPGRCCVVLSLD